MYSCGEPNKSVRLEGGRKGGRRDTVTLPFLVKGCVAVVVGLGGWRGEGGLGGLERG
jgi:hypothetical protein